LDAKYARVIGSIDNAWHNVGFISKIGWCDKLENILTFFPLQFAKANGNKSATLLVLKSIMRKDLMMYFL
jgi:hypothetical protein